MEKIVQSVNNMCTSRVAGFKIKVFNFFSLLRRSILSHSVRIFLKLWFRSFEKAIRASTFFQILAHCVWICCSNEIILKLINEQNSWGLGTHLPAENMVSKDNLLHKALTTFQTNSQSNGRSILSGTLLQNVLQMHKYFDNLTFIIDGYYWHQYIGWYQTFGLLQ